MQTVEQALALTTPCVLGVHGIMAKVTTETITMKDAKVCKLTTVTIASGPPLQTMSINFWHARPDHATRWEDLVHQCVNITMIRCVADRERGTHYESIGKLTQITSAVNASMEQWWLQPNEVAND